VYKNKNREDIMINYLKSIKKRVSYLLKNYPETRDSDKLLYLKYLNMFCHMDRNINDLGYNGYERIFLAKSTPSFESISRVRRKFQEAGLYIGKSRDQRMEESKKVSDWANDTDYYIDACEPKNNKDQKNIGEQLNLL
jgi:hypothetical protein